LENHFISFNPSRLMTNIAPTTTPNHRQPHGALILLVSMLIVSGINYALNTVLTRLLEPDDFGRFAAFNALFWLVTLLPTALQQAVARRASLRPTTPPGARLARSWGLYITALTLLISPAVAAALSLPIWWIWLLAAITPVYAALGARRGAVQAQQPERLAQNLLLEIGSKGLIMLGAWFVGGIHAAVIGVVAAIALAALHLRAPLAANDTELEVDARAALAGMFGQTAINNSDVLLAKALLPPQEAGTYAAIALIGKVVFFAAQPITTVAFAPVAQSDPRQNTHLRLLWIALVATTLIGGGITLTCLLFGPAVTGALLGERFVSSAPWLGLYALATTLYALANVCLNHLLALGKRFASSLSLGGAATQIVLILGWHGSGLEIIAAQILAMSVLLIVSLCAVLVSSAKRHPAPIVLP
jgi:O-antigen/teichoic acid export membrane protein